jgi:hypothetical protein
VRLRARWPSMKSVIIASTNTAAGKNKYTELLTSKK